MRYSESRWPSIMAMEKGFQGYMMNDRASKKPRWPGPILLQNSGLIKKQNVFLNGFGF